MGEQYFFPTKMNSETKIKDLLKMRDILQYQVEVNRLGDLYHENAVNHFRKILKKKAIDIGQIL